ncbi:hypothetical protein CHU98_g2052 [Xylaria longipes]|nr:hypothetical protein CHU98_g2052 [Xylaria longipes]
MVTSAGLQQLRTVLQIYLMDIPDNFPALAIAIWRDGNRATATHMFCRIVKRLETADGPNSKSISEPFQDDSLQRVCASLEPFVRQNLDSNDLEDLASSLFSLANHPLDNFYLLCSLAQDYHLRLVEPIYYPPIRRSLMPVVPDQVSELRGAFLARDNHHGAIPRGFNLKEAENDTRKDGQNASEDCGNLILEDASSVDVLEVAHNIPHSYANYKRSSEWNAISRTRTLHLLFGDIYIFTERTEDPAALLTPSTEVKAQKDSQKSEEEKSVSVGVVHPEKEEEKRYKAKKIRRQGYPRRKAERRPPLQHGEDPVRAEKDEDPHKDEIDNELFPLYPLSRGSKHAVEVRHVEIGFGHLLRSHPLRIAISGGGLAGASLMHDLFQCPHLDVHIFKSASAFKEVGLAIGVTRNAQAALDLISPQSAQLLKRAGAVPMRGVRFIIAQREGQGEVINEVDHISAGKRLTNIIHHAAYLQELLANVPHKRLHASKRLSSIDRNLDSITLRFTDKTTHEYDILVGANAIHSTVRKFILRENDPAARPINTGFWVVMTLQPYVKAQGTIGQGPVDSEDAREYSWIGNGSYIMHNVLSDGKLVQFA